MPDDVLPAVAVKRPVWSVVEKHLALVVALALVVFAVMRVFFLSGFDLSTALSVLAIVDRTQLLTASVLAAITLVVPLVFINPGSRAWLLAGNTSGAPFLTQLRTGLLWLPLSGVVVFGMSLSLVVGWVLGFLTLVAVNAIRRRRARKAGAPLPDRTEKVRFSSDASGWLIATFAGWTLLTVMSAPWLAKEAVHIGVDDAQVGYVIGEQAGMTLILTSPGSDAAWVRSENIESRAVCRQAGQWWTSSLGSLIPKEGEDCAAILKTN